MHKRQVLAEALDTLEAEALAVVMHALRPVLRHIARLVTADLDGLTRASMAGPQVTLGAEPHALPCHAQPCHAVPRRALPRPDDGSGPLGLTAAVVDELSDILQLWGESVDSSVLPHFRRIFEAGGLAAVSRLAELRHALPMSEAFRAAEGAPLGPLFDEAASRHLALARNRFAGVGETAWKHARTTLLEGLEGGLGTDQIARNLRGVSDLSQGMASLIARTEVVSAANAGADARMALAGDEAPKFKQWLCVTADTRVWSPEPREVVKRRRPPGRLVRLTAQSGHVLTVTPKHPILTDRGWVTADAVEVGSHLVRHRNIEAVADQLPAAPGWRRSVLGHDPHVDDPPPTVDELHRAATQRWPHRRMVARVVDFDSGGADCEVEVVPLDGDLLADLEPAGGEPASEGSFVLSDVCLAALFADGTLDQRTGRHAPAGVDPSRSGYSMGDRLGAVTAGSYDPGGAAVATLDPAVIEPAGDGLVGHTPYPSEGVSAVAAQVTLDEVAEIEWVRESGWHDVYDLTTDCGWFVANGFIVHNSTLDSRTRPTHVTADGQVVERTERFQVGASQMLYPGDPAGAMKETANCRCTTIYTDNPNGEMEGVEGRQEGGVLDDTTTVLDEGFDRIDGEFGPTSIEGAWDARSLADLENLSNQLTSEYLLRLRRIAVDPHTRQTYSRFIAGTPGTIPSGEIFVPKGFTDYARMVSREAALEDVAVKPNWKDSVVHEYGHLLDSWIQQDEHTNEQLNEALAAAVTEDGEPVLDEEGEPVPVVEHPPAMPSAFGMLGRDAVVAEGFVDWWWNGKNSKPISQFIGALAQSMLGLEH